ncbi:unnamed protein product [Rotaria socialis]|uniref:Uncharacterized protein n=1 Tax=Rotaria socialis TaxID=392032 RepID=A0A820KN07_9BILA|nr:unnamed protein product [Rotaria socialis]
MNNTIDYVDQEISNNIDKSRVYSYIDGIFDCTLMKYDDDNNKNILDEIQITIVYEPLKYSLLTHKSLVLCIVVVYEREAAIQMTFVFTTKILQRSLAEENIDEHTELKDTDTDLALLMLDNEIPNITEDQYLNPKFDFVSLKSDTYNKYVSINSNQFQTFIGETISPNVKDAKSPAG